LNIHKRRLGLFGNPTADQREIARLLRVSAVKDSPAGVGYGHNVIVTRVNVQRMRREGASADMKDNRQPFAGDRKQHFLHQDQSLTRSEIGNAPTCDSESFTSARGAVLGFGLD